ncbi:MAG: hypoxanthine phosphoribosyltransferase [Bacteroidaceae bacterium]|nr:hypoxanthine phosphoribosyltransferase [Bacteroidaceae bacterium]
MTTASMITIKDKQFEPFIHHEQIAEKVAALAERLNADYVGRNPILIAILNGAFMFAADLVRHLNFDHEIQFAKFSSYDGMDTTGTVRELIGLSIDIRDREVIIVEDIIDTGTTMYNLLPQLEAKGAKSVEIATLLMKPGKLRVPLNVKYCAMEIPNEFIVGYGLDYDGIGRNYKSIYVVKEA